MITNSGKNNILVSEVDGSKKDATTVNNGLYERLKKHNYAAAAHDTEDYGGDDDNDISSTVAAFVVVEGGATPK